MKRRMNPYNPKSSSCLDLSNKEIYMILYFEESDPGREYELVSQKNVFSSCPVLEKGSIVTAKFGHARVQGKVVTLTDDFKTLELNFKRITREHQEYLKVNARSKKPYVDQDCQTRCTEKRIMVVANATTQTEPELLSHDFLELKMKYEELVERQAVYESMFSDVQMDLQDTLSKFGNGTTSRTRNLSGSSASSWTSPNLSPMMSQEHSPSHFPWNNGVLRSTENQENVNHNFTEMVQIGANGTKIAKHVYDTINWNSYTAATRKLLILLFSRKVLATHSLSGKPSPAFPNHPNIKKKLDPTITSDIIEVVSRKCKVGENLVRMAITTKCADENKMRKKKLLKQKNNK